MSTYIQYLITDFIKSNRYVVIIYIILNLVIYPINSIYLPKLYSILVNKTTNNPISINKQKGGAPVTTTTSTSTVKYYADKIIKLNPSNITEILIVLAIVSIFLSILFRVKHYMNTQIFPKYSMWLRQRIFKSTLQRRNTDFAEQPVGKEIMRLEDIIFTSKEVFNFIIIDLLELILIVVLILGYLFYLNPKIGLYSSIQVLLITILIVFGYKKIEKITFERVKQYYTIGNNIDNSYTNLSNVLINNRISEELKKNHSSSIKYKKTQEKSKYILHNMNFLIRIITIITFIIVIWKGYQLTQKNKLSKISFITIIFLLLHFQGFLYAQSSNFVFFLDRLCQLKYNNKYIQDIIKETQPGKNLTNTITEGTIEFIDINFTYNQSTAPVLKNLNLIIPGSKKTALLGKSGSGKSTLMKLLIRFYSPNSGKILIDNIPHTDIDISYLRNQINYINQNTQLFDEDIYYNIKYGNKITNDYTVLTPSTSDTKENNTEEKQNERIRNLLIKHDLLTIYDNLDNGLLTKAGPKGTNLSLGMQKVTILIRGLLRDSKIVIFDEPLAGLDQKTREKVMNMIKQETQNKTVIVITHDIEILPHMDKVINLKDINGAKNNITLPPAL